MGMNNTSAVCNSNDIGCYVDGARGIYAIDKIVRFAVDQGFVLTGEDEYGEPLSDMSKSLSDYEFKDELEDQIDEFMNNNWPVSSAYWGRNESGDWGLWDIQD